MNIFPGICSVALRGKCSDRPHLCQPSDVEDTKPKRVLWVAATAPPAWASPRLWLHWIPLWRRCTHQPPPASFLPTLHTSFIIADLMCSLFFFFFQKFILIAAPYTADSPLHARTHSTLCDRPCCVRARALNFPLIYFLLYYSNESSFLFRGTVQCDVPVTLSRSRCLHWTSILNLWPCDQLTLLY